MLFHHGFLLRGLNLSLPAQGASELIKLKRRLSYTMNLAQLQGGLQYSDIVLRIEKKQFLGVFYCHKH